MTEPGVQDDEAPIENAEFTINAWHGGAGAVSGTFADNLIGYVARPVALPVQLQYAVGRDLSKWDGKNGGGWTLVLPHDPKKSLAEQARPLDAPESIQRLWEHRGSPPVLRYVLKGPNRVPSLRRYERREDGTVVVGDHDVAQGIGEVGLRRVPFYLLLVGKPSVLPWSLQFELNGNRAVGRIDLEENDGLAHYVDCLINGWDDDGAKASSAVLWSVDHDGGEDDITSIMRQFIGNVFDASLAEEEMVKQRAFLAGRDATVAGLGAKLRALRPGLIITTSHGVIPAAGSLEQRRAALGLPMDQSWTPLDPKVHLKDWDPAGAVWYAHACCSAGSEGAERYDGLIVPTSPAGIALRDAAQAGDAVAPLPRWLIGRSHPVRGFIGHVGPTFSWTLRRPKTGECLTSPILDAFFTSFYQETRFPLGHVILPLFERTRTLLIQARNLTATHRASTPTATCTPILDRILPAEDLQGTVLIGDPTALIPPY
jgi:hypothetical protein